MNIVYLTILITISISFIIGLFLVYYGGMDEYRLENYDVRDAISSLKKTSKDKRLKSVSLDTHIERIEQTDPLMDEEII